MKSRSRKLNQLIIDIPGKLETYPEEGYDEVLITGAAFVDHSVIYDSVNHIILTRELFEITQDVMLKEALYIIGCGVSRLGDCGVKVG